MLLMYGALAHHEPLAPCHFCRAAGVSSKALAHLPKDKQYLVIRNGERKSQLRPCVNDDRLHTVPSVQNQMQPRSVTTSSLCSVPCRRRVAEVEGYDEAAEQLLETDAQGDGWVSTAEPSHRDTTEADIPDLDEPNQISSSQNTANAEDDVPDFDDLGIEDEDDEACHCCICHACCAVLPGNTATCFTCTLSPRAQT